MTRLVRNVLAEAPFGAMAQRRESAHCSCHHVRHCGHICFRIGKPVSTSQLSRRADRSPGWFADRPLAVKFGILIAVVVIAFGGVLTAVVVGDSRVQAANEDLKRLNDAQKLAYQLDTRASELKVDGFKTAVRPDPGAELDELKGDIATPTAMMAALDDLHLTGRPASAVADLEDKYGKYIQGISAY